MANEQRELGPGAIYELFNQYASARALGVRGLSHQSMKQLMTDMDLLEGVPAGLGDVCVREHLQRADQDGNGIIGPQDFVVWLLTEVAALLPVRDAFCAATGVRPLYNQYHAVLLGDVGFTEGSRKPATGMLAWQFLKLVELYGLLGPGAAAAAAAGEGARAGPSEVARQAVKAARAAVGAARGASGGGTGAQAAEAAGGGKLQFAAFVRALSLLAGRKMSSPDIILYQVVSCGQPPSGLTGKGAAAAASSPAPASDSACAGVGLNSLLEGPLAKESYTCHNCGQQHNRWRLCDWVKLEALALSVGIPAPVRQHLPHLALVNTRNLRVTFHRYNAQFNRGKMPPSSYRLPYTTRMAPELAEGAPNGGDGGGLDEPDAPFGACCCLFRSLSLMELSAWLRLCADCDFISGGVATHGSGLTVARLEAVFVAAAAVAGAYHADDSAGIHDLPPNAHEAPKLTLQRNRMGGVASSDTRGSGDHVPRRSSAAHNPPVAAAATLGSNAAHLHMVKGPTSAAAWLANARSLPYGGGAATTTGGGGAGGQQQHRPARLTLNFPQFLEALRMVSEEAWGHPTNTAKAEQALLRIAHDLVREGCPRPDPTTAAGTVQLRQRMAAADGDWRPGQQRDSGAAAPAPAPAAMASHASFTSATTSTKYSYHDFTPPDSNAYTSAASSRVLSRTASAASAAPGGRRAPAGGGGGLLDSRTASFTSATTSTKYTYDDFTPPDSNAFTSAASSRAASRPASAGRTRASIGSGAPAAATPPPAGRVLGSNVTSSGGGAGSRRATADSDGSPPMPPPPSAWARPAAATHASPSASPSGLHRPHSSSRPSYGGSSASDHPAATPLSPSAVVGRQHPSPAPGGAETATPTAHGTRGAQSLGSKRPLSAGRARPSGGGASTAGSDPDGGGAGGGGSSGGGPKLAFGRSIPHPEVPRLNLQALTAGAGGGVGSGPAEAPHASDTHSARSASTAAPSTATATQHSHRARSPGRSARSTASGSAPSGEPAPAPASTPPRPSAAAAPSSRTPSRQACSNRAASPLRQQGSEILPSGAGTGGHGRSITPNKSRAPDSGFVTPLPASKSSVSVGQQQQHGPHRRRSDAGSSAGGKPPAGSVPAGSPPPAKPRPPPPMAAMTPGESVAAARQAAAALEPNGGDGGEGRSLLKCGSGLRNTLLLVARNPSVDGAGPGLHADAEGGGGAQSTARGDAPARSAAASEAGSRRESSAAWGEQRDGGDARSRPPLSAQPSSVASAAWPPDSGRASRRSTGAGDAAAAAVEDGWQVSYGRAMGSAPPRRGSAGSGVGQQHSSNGGANDTGGTGSWTAGGGGGGSPSRIPDPRAVPVVPYTAPSPRPVSSVGQHAGPPHPGMPAPAVDSPAPSARSAFSAAGSASGRRASGAGTPSRPPLPPQPTLSPQHSALEHVLLPETDSTSAETHGVGAGRHGLKAEASAASSAAGAHAAWGKSQPASARRTSSRATSEAGAGVPGEQEGSQAVGQEPSYVASEAGGSVRGTLRGPLARVSSVGSGGAGAGAGARAGGSPRHAQAIGRERRPPQSYEGTVNGVNQYYFDQGAES